MALRNPTRYSDGHKWPVDLPRRGRDLVIVPCYDC